MYLCSNFLSTLKSVRKFAIVLAVGIAIVGVSEPVAFAGTDKAVKAAYAGNKARARSIMHKRSIWGHFRAMDSNNSWSLTYKEMDRYFSAMHHAFDVNGDGVVSVREAPKIMLKYTVSGEPFPSHGLNLPTLRHRLQRLFRLLDKNSNRVLSIGELT